MLNNSYLNDLNAGAEVIFNLEQEFYMFKNKGDKYYARKYVANQNEIKKLHDQFIKSFETVKIERNNIDSGYTVIKRKGESL